MTYERDITGILASSGTIIARPTYARNPVGEVTFTGTVVRQGFLMRLITGILPWTGLYEWEDAGYLYRILSLGRKVTGTVTFYGGLTMKEIWKRIFPTWLSKMVDVVSSGKKASASVVGKSVDTSYDEHR